MPRPLTDQIEAVTQLLNGEMPPDDAIHSVLATLEWLQRNETTVKNAIADAAALRAALAADPLVQEIKELFPGAELVDD